MRSIYNPFSVVRHLDFWSMAAHGGDDSGSSSSSDNGSSSNNSSPAPAPAPTPAAPPTFKNLTEASKAGYHGQAVNIAGKGLQKVSFGDKSYDKKMASASASAKKPSVGTSSNKASNKASNTYTSPGQSGQDFATQFKANPSAFMPPAPGPGSNKVNSALQDLKNTLTPFDNKEYVGGDLIDTSRPVPGVDKEFQERFRTQKIAAAADPYGMSTQSGAVLTNEATDMLDSAGASAQDYVDAVDAFGARLDAPATGLAAISPFFGGIAALGEMDQRRAYEQLTGDYRPSGIARVLGIADSTTTRYVPVMDGGQIVGSLSVDASGNPVAYTGSRPENATIMDPTINKEAAMGLIRGPEPLFGSASNDSDDGPGYGMDLTAVGDSGDVDPCPEGYRMNPETNVCEIDPFETPFPTQGPMPANPGTPPFSLTAATSPYMAASPYTLPSLLPQGQPTFTVPTPTVQPITIAQQTATGLAGLPFRRS